MNTTVREDRETQQFVAPTASVIENGDGYILQVEMPGVSKDGLEISVENNEMTIVGRRSLPAVEGTLVHRESRRENQFSRSTGTRARCQASPGPTKFVSEHRSERKG